MWLRGRECPCCGSRLVQWVYEWPHCFVCGFNSPDGRQELGEFDLPMFGTQADFDDLRCGDNLYEVFRLRGINILSHGKISV